jgi:hypothetical protein
MFVQPLKLITPTMNSTTTQPNQIASMAGSVIINGPLYFLAILLSAPETELFLLFYGPIGFILSGAMWIVGTIILAFVNRTALIFWLSVQGVLALLLGGLILSTSLSIS